MITGIVTTDREALVRFPVRGSDDQETEVEAVIDTGYNGTLILPPELIQRLALTSRGSREVILGDGSAAQMEIYRATIVWDNQPIDVQTLAAEGGAIIGMALLSGYRVTLDVIDGGVVTIEALPVADG